MVYGHSVTRLFFVEKKKKVDFNSYCYSRFAIKNVHCFLIFPLWRKDMFFRSDLV